MNDERCVKKKWCQKSCKITLLVEDTPVAATGSPSASSFLSPAGTALMKTTLMQAISHCNFARW